MVRFLTLLQVPHPEKHTLKAFRASRAEVMARRGHPVPEVLRAGEWRSAAMLDYADPDAFNQGALLAKAFEEAANSSDDD